MGRDHPGVKRTIGTNRSVKIINYSSYGLTLNNFLTYLTAFISASVKKKKSLLCIRSLQKIPTALLCKPVTNFLGVWLVGKYQSEYLQLKSHLISSLGGIQQGLNNHNNYPSTQQPGRGQGWESSSTVGLAAAFGRCCSWTTCCTCAMLPPDNTTRMHKGQTARGGLTAIRQRSQRCSFSYCGRSRASLIV